MIKLHEEDVKRIILRDCLKSIRGKSKWLKNVPATDIAIILADVYDIAVDRIEADANNIMNNVDV